MVRVLTFSSEHFLAIEPEITGMDDHEDSTKVRKVLQHCYSADIRYKSIFVLFDIRSKSTQRNRDYSMSSSGSWLFGNGQKGVGVDAEKV
jgi:hypothetical protein